MSRGGPRRRSTPCSCAWCSRSAGARQNDSLRRKRKCGSKCNERISTGRKELHSSRARVYNRFASAWWMPEENRFATSEEVTRGARAARFHHHGRSRAANRSRKERREKRTQSDVVLGPDRWHSQRRVGKSVRRVAAAPR